MAYKELFFYPKTVLTSAINPCAGLSALRSAVVVSGGTGYKVNDVLAVAGGTVLMIAYLKVTEVTPAGVIVAVEVHEGGLLGGAYTTKPGNPASVTGGSGSGSPTFTLTWSDDVAPPKAAFATIQAETQDVKYRMDGTNPTAAVGELLKANDTILVSRADLLAIKLIEVAASAKINTVFYRN